MAYFAIMHEIGEPKGTYGGPHSWEIVATMDGSHTLVSADGQLTFHSRHGAMTESRHVFIQNGLEFWLAMGQNSLKPLRVLELGLGTGLNASLVLEAWRGRLATWIPNSENISGKGAHLVNWSYTALETSPLDPLLLGELNYGVHMRDEAREDWLAGYRSIYSSLQDVSFIQRFLEGGGEGPEEHLAFRTEFNESHIVMKVLPQGWVQNLEGVYEVIFYDAFGPSAQPELWGEQAVSLLVERLTKGGVMVTYGAQGAFRRHLLQAGLLVERLPGPPGKREMLRAMKG